MEWFPPQSLWWNYSSLILYFQQRPHRKSKGKTIRGHPTNYTSRQSQHQIAVFTSHSNSPFPSSPTDREQELSLRLLHILLSPFIHNPNSIKTAHRTQYCFPPLKDSHISFSHYQIHPLMNNQKEEVNWYYYSMIYAHIMNKASHSSIHTNHPACQILFSHSPILSLRMDIPSLSGYTILEKRGEE